MHPTFRETLGHMLPDELPYPHFAEREAAWLLHQRLDGPARISTLRRGPLAPLLQRPGVAEVIATCGDGWIRPEQLWPLADPLYAFGRERELAVDRPAQTAFDIAAVADWRMFTVSFAEWVGENEQHCWQALQVSRAGGNLVLQVNFPEDYCGQFRRIFGQSWRAALEYYGHPVRRSGPITMAWARLDLDEWGEDLLIEEIQTDWLRATDVMRKRMLQNLSKHHRVEARMFLQMTRDVFARDWARVVMLAVLAFARRELGVSRIWMHQPKTGAKLKRIHDDRLPPRSIYTDLPRRFGFKATDQAPEFLYRARGKALKNLRRSGQPVFWRLDLATDASLARAA